MSDYGAVYVGLVGVLHIINVVFITRFVVVASLRCILTKLPFENRDFTYHGDEFARRVGEWQFLPKICNIHVRMIMMNPSYIHCFFLSLGWSVVVSKCSYV